MFKTKKTTSESVQEEEPLPQQHRQIEWVDPNPGLDKSIFLFNAVVGEGGFGCVYSALLLSSERWIAVKEIRKFELLKHNSGHKMLTNELKALKRLEHPFIIPLHLAFQDRIACYMVFDLKLGGDLRYFLRHNVCFEERDVAFIVACISSALKHVHAKGVIHRDIKPENIIVDQMGFPYLADFGVAYVHPTSRRDAPCGLVSQLASGTKQYLAPEVITRSHVHGPESDFWSLGVVAYEMIYGERPFKIHCPIELIRCVDEAFYLHKSRKGGSSKAVDEFLSSKMPATGHEHGPVETGAVDESIVRMGQMRMTDIDNQLSNTDDQMQQGSRKVEDISMSPESHWDFDFIEDEKFSNELKVPLPEISAVLGQVSQEAWELMRGLLDIRPNMRLGSRMCPHKIQEAPLLVKWKVNDEKTLLAKQIRPSFVPGRKFLLFGSDPNNGGNDPYSAAVGKGVSADDLSLSAEDQAKFDGFYYLSGAALPL